MRSLAVFAAYWCIACASNQALAQNIKIAISTDNSRIVQGKPILIHVEVENLTSKLVVFPAPRSSSYDVGVIVRNSQGVALKPKVTQSAGSRFAYFIKPHGVLKEDLDVNKVVVITGPGEYTISIHKENATTGGAAESNTLTVSVLADAVEKP